MTLDADALAALARRPALRRVFAAIDFDAEETRIVGGAVRDTLTGRGAREIDLATTATPALVAERVSAAGLRVLPTGLEHGTLTLRVDDESFEITTLREDVETDGRRARVRFGRDFRADALRRDFTINALFVGADGRLFDYVGGLPDLAARRVRFIGDPTARIREDYLRVLRFFRFWAEYGEGPPDAAAVRAAIQERDGLARLSRERVRAEIFKLLTSRRAPDGAEEMTGAGLLGPLLAVAPNPARLRRLIAAGVEADALLRLAALALAVAEDAERLFARLRLSNAERDRLAQAADVVVALRARSAPPSDRTLAETQILYGRQAALDGARLALLDAPGLRSALDRLREAPPRLNLSGSDFARRGLAGPQIGAALKILRRRWIDADFPQDEAELARLADEAARAAGAPIPR